MSITETKLPNGNIRIWPTDPATRTIPTCTHWTADPDHLARGTCALRLYGGLPVLGNCLVNCPEYTGNDRQREDETHDMFQKYARPGEAEIRRAIRTDQAADAVTDRPIKDDLKAQAHTLAADGAALRKAYHEERSR